MTSQEGIKYLFSVYVNHVSNDCANQIHRRSFPKVFTVESNGFSGGLWMFWDDSLVDILIIQSQAQVIHANV